MQPVVTAVFNTSGDLYIYIYIYIIIMTNETILHNLYYLQIRRFHCNAELGAAGIRECPMVYTVCGCVGDIINAWCIPQNWCV